VDYCEAAGILGLTDPYPNIEFQLDVEKFITLLEPADAHILRLFLFKLNQTEIAQEVGVCQATVCNRLRAIKVRFAEFYQS
jgi:DNA-directed RNA polymerase specialized sigma24 family protein